MAVAVLTEGGAYAWEGSVASARAVDFNVDCNVEAGTMAGTDGGQRNGRCR